MEINKYKVIYPFLLLLLFALLLQTTVGESSTKKLHIIKKALDDKGCERLQQAFPEGAFFGLVLYGLSWAQIAVLDSNEQVFEKAISEVNWALKRLEGDFKIKNQFEEHLIPRYGIFYAGWLNLLQGRIVQISKNKENYLSLIENFQKRCDEISSALEGSNCVFLQSYEGSSWPADNTVAISSLALHDKILGTKYSETVLNWVSKVKFHLEDSTGLVPHSVDPLSCNTIEGARGSSQVLMNCFWPLISKDFAKDQFSKFKKLFNTRVLFLRMVREYPKGKNGYGDVDSGPVVFGAGATATIVGLGAYRANDDVKSWKSLLNSVNFLKWPTGLIGKKRYNNPNILIGELFIIWSNLQQTENIQKQ